VSSPKIKTGPLGTGEVTRILMKECEDQSERLTKLEEALTEEDYARVAELVDSLDDCLHQGVQDERTQVVRPLVTGFHPKSASR
jgi:hypothetical protein